MHVPFAFALITTLSTKYAWKCSTQQRPRRTGTLVPGASLVANLHPNIINLHVTRHAGPLSRLPERLLRRAQPPASHKGRLTMRLQLPNGSSLPLRQGEPLVLGREHLLDPDLKTNAGATYVKR